MARRRASSTLEAGSPRDYPEHLNPFRDAAADEDEGVQLRGGDERYGTLGRLRRRASFSSTWSMLTLRRSRPPSAPPSPCPSARASSVATAPSSSASSPRRRLRLSELQGWLTLSTRRRSRSASAAQPSPPVTPSPPSPARSPPAFEPFVLSPRTHRYRSAPPTPPEEAARRAALRLYGPQAVTPSGSSKGEAEESDALPAGPLPPLRIEEPPEQPLRAREAVRKAAEAQTQTQTQTQAQAQAEHSTEEGGLRPPRPPRVRKRPAPPPPIAKPASAPAPTPAPTTPPADSAAATITVSEDSAPEADQVPPPATASKHTPGPQGDEDGAEGAESESARNEEGSPLAPPRKPRRASVSPSLVPAPTPARRELPCA